MPLPDGATLDRLLKDARPELLTSNLPIERVRFSGARAWELAQGIEGKLRPLVERAERIFAADQRAELIALDGQIGTDAAVFYATDLQIDAIERDPTFDTDAREVRRLDKTLYKWLDTHLGEDAAIQPELRRIRSGTGYRDDAEDVLAEVALARRHWARIERTFPHTAEELTTFEQTAARFLSMVTARPLAQGRAERTLWAKAWTRFMVHYVRLVRNGRYLMEELGDEGDPRATFPSLTAT